MESVVLKCKECKKRFKESQLQVDIYNGKIFINCPDGCEIGETHITNVCNVERVLENV